MARLSSRRPSRYQRDQRIARLGTALLFVVVAAVSLWAFHKSSTRQSDSPHRAATAPTSASDSQMRVDLRAWLTASEPLINALVIARNNIAAAAARHDVPGAGAACQTATGAVADLHRQMPSPQPALTGQFQEAISDYGIGLPYCVGATRVDDGAGLRQAASYISAGDAAMQAALDFLGQVPGCEPRDFGVLIV